MCNMFLLLFSFPPPTRRTREGARLIEQPKPPILLQLRISPAAWEILSERGFISESLVGKKLK